MKIEAFDMVRMQCAYEREVDYDLSGSGIPSMKLSELIGTRDAAEAVFEVPQGYAPAGGSPHLRSAIAAMYRDASAENVMVTNGATEANLVAALRLLEKGDELVAIVPSYLQTWNLARSWGIETKPLSLLEDLDWQLDVEAIKASVTQKTKAIQICNPNNPTGAVMAAEQRKALIDAAEDVGAWILSDEVYVGAEREGTRTESFWGDYEKVLVTNGLCKAYALPGLRIGWLVGGKEILKEIVPYRDYIALTHAEPSDAIAKLVLEPDRRERILAQNRAIVQKSYGHLAEWMKANEPAFSLRPPVAGPMCFIRYVSKISSLEVAERLRKEKSVLVVPGSQMGVDGYLRIGLGLPKEYLHAALNRLNESLLRLEPLDIP
jgi:aspartate/methionine/tyrosine aminotransferase